MKDNKISLNIKDRLNIPSMLPRDSDLLEQKIVRDILAKIEINQEEMKEINLRQEGNQCKWDPVKDKEIIFTEIEFDIMKKSVNKLDKDKKINQSNLSLCIKIQDFRIEEDKKENINKS